MASEHFFMTTEQLISQQWKMGRTAQCIERNLFDVYGVIVTRSEIWSAVRKMNEERSKQPKVIQ